LIASCLAWLSRHAASILALSVLIGLVLPPLAALLKPILGPTVLLIFTAAFLRLDRRAMIGHITRPAILALATVWMLAGTPLVVWLITRDAGLPGRLGEALVLVASSPSLISMPAYALMLGLDAALNVTLLVVTSVLIPLVQPLVVLALLGVDLQVSPWALMARLALFVGGGIAAALIIEAIMGRRRIEYWAPQIAGLNLIVLVVFAVGVMDGVTALLLDRPGFVLGFAAAAFALNFGLMALTTAVFWWAGARAALSVGLAGGNRNFAVLVSVLGATADADLVLYLAIGQFPIYIVPVVMDPICRRLVGRRR